MVLGHTGQKAFLLPHEGLVKVSSSLNLANYIQPDAAKEPSNSRGSLQKRVTPVGPAASAPLPSGFSAAFLSASRFLWRAVVDSTAVGTLAATLLASAVTGLGYANSDGLHLHTTCAADAWFRPHCYADHSLLLHSCSRIHSSQHQLIVTDKGSGCGCQNSLFITPTYHAQSLVGIAQLQKQSLWDQ